MTVHRKADSTARAPLPRGCARSAASLDPDERACLFLARCCFNYYTAPSPALWKRAMRAAQEQFGRDRVFHALTVVFARLRETRARALLYHKPDCPACSAWLTTHEAGLMRALSAVRRDDPCTALMMGLLICDRSGPEPLLHGLNGLAAALRAAERG